MHWLISLLLNAIALLLADYLISGFHVSGAISAVFAVFILGIVNAVIRPLLVLLTLPATLITLGLFILVINAITFQLASWFVPGFHVYSFGGAFLGALVTSAFNWVLNGFFNKND